MVLGRIVTVERTVTADDADALAGTQLDQPGVPGVYTIWVGSTVGDTLLTISMGGQVIADGVTVVERANAEIRENEDPFFQVVAVQGRPVVNINIQTAGTARIRTRFLPAI